MVGWREAPLLAIILLTAHAKQEIVLTIAQQKEDYSWLYAEW
jgi:hypothetical protein